MRRPKWLIVLAVAAVLVFGPVMGLCIAMPGSSSSNGPAVRVLTQNMGELKLEDPRLWNLIADVRPDIVFLQECGAKTYPPVSLDPAYHLHVDHNTCLLTKYPILKVDSRDRTDVWKKNGSGAITLYELQHPSRTIAAFNLHLETIREALESLRWKRFGGISDLKANLEERRWESELAHDWARHTTAPLVIGGDFNMPVESAIYRDYWSDFTNAFSKVGMGYGRTKQTRLFGMRIDHILTGPGWSIEAAWVVPDIGSDHRGMAAIVHLD